ncbi:MAG: methanogenesis marker 12 protein [Methanosarcinaceae archaeon]|nr:methanogenesis marker 12 protein [Methanosarcinaceae archaeon]
MPEFLGIDHGTAAIRFAHFKDEFTFFELPREYIAKITDKELKKHIESEINAEISDISMTVVTYSMGDAINSIENIHSVKNRGLLKEGGAGKSTGAGTRVFDLFKSYAKNAALLPGITRKSPTDPRFKIYSHQASPEKIGALYDTYSDGYDNFILSDISSNTVSLAVMNSKIVGGFDACIFAPGFQHGAIDLDAIRAIDEGKITANEAFSNAGVSCKLSESIRNETVALFAAMEISALSVLFQPEKIPYSVFISGNGGDNEFIHKEIEKHLGKKINNRGKWSAARGCCKIAKDIYKGKKEILGIEVSNNI